MIPMRDASPGRAGLYLLAAMWGAAPPAWDGNDPQFLRGLK
jgi:hypothetical protein